MTAAGPPGGLRRYARPLGSTLLRRLAPGLLAGGPGACEAEALAVLVAHWLQDPKGADFPSLCVFDIVEAIRPQLEAHALALASLDGGGRPPPFYVTVLDRRYVVCTGRPDIYDTHSGQRREDLDLPAETTTTLDLNARRLRMLADTPGRAARTPEGTTWDY